jgi:TrmH family RNA methyltransferase
MSELNNNIRIVMVNTSHPGNIGAVARVMKNMCLSSLYLVEPRHFPSEEANARSSGALDILQHAVVCESLEQAIADCELVIGTSARERSADWPVLNPKQSANKLVQTARQSQVALVMGRESSGLTNQELDLCQYLVHIPSNPDYNSLNVAMAVQVFAYEIYLQMQTTLEQNDKSGEEGAVLTSGQMQNFFVHLEQTLLDIDFLDERRSELLMRRLRQLFYRARPSQDEMNILRGILSAAQGRKSMRKTSS